MGRVRRAAAAVVLGVLTSACAAPTAPATQSTEPGTATTRSAEPEPEPAGSEPSSGSTVPDTLRFEARTVAGQPFDGASLAGSPTLLWFWAPWCPTCHSQIPQVKQIAAAHSGEVDVVGVGGLSDDPGAIADFASQVPRVTHLSDSEGAVWRHFGVIEQSSFVLLDAEGKQVLTTGYGGADDLADQVAALLR